MMKRKFGFLLLAAVVLWSYQLSFAQAAQHALGSNIVATNGTVYTITTENNATVRSPYTSAGAFLSYGFNSWSSVVVAAPEDLALPVGSFIPPQDGQVICSDRGTDKGTCYLITGGRKAGFTSEDVFRQLGYNFKYALHGDVSFLASADNIDSAVRSHLPGSLVNKDGTVYLVVEGGLVGLPSWSVLQSWGYSATDIVRANSADRALSVVGNLRVRQAGQISAPIITVGGNNPDNGNVPDYSKPPYCDKLGNGPIGCIQPPLR